MTIECAKELAEITKRNVNEQDRTQLMEALVLLYDELYNELNNKYTVRFAHLESTPLKVGDIVKPDSIIGKIGNTGDSTATHLHIDCVKGLQTGRYSLLDIENNKPEPDPRQLNYFIDEKLFHIKPVITSFYCDPEYQAELRKVHFGYDLVPEDRHRTKTHYDIHWNRSINGRVVAINNDKTGYGLCVYVVFER